MNNTKQNNAIELIESVLKKDEDEYVSRKIQFSGSPLCPKCSMPMIRKGVCFICFNCGVDTGSCG